jgi:hypothetical protein
MDDNTRQVLVALIGALGGFLTGVFVAKLGFDHARSTDAARGEREERIRREDDDRRQRERWLADQRHAVAEFVASLEELVGESVLLEAGKGDPPRRLAAELRANRGFAELRMMAPGLSEVARTALVATREVATAAEEGREYGRLLAEHVKREMALVDAAAALLRTEIDDGRHADTRTA